MEKFVLWIQAFAQTLGGPGLFVVAFLDSSFISLPEINDLLLVLMVTQHKSRMAYYAGSATLGSLVGCLVLYYLGRKGDQWVARRFSASRVANARATFQRYGVMTVLIPSLLPPPAPFKVFVLLSGICGISVGRFAMAIAIGRGIRYFGEGLLAVWYGDQAVEFIRANSRPVALALAGVAVLGLAAYVLWRRTQDEKRRKLLAGPPAGEPDLPA
jgi:membrane protein YqaA with SNARE-associated domain